MTNVGAIVGQREWKSGMARKEVGSKRAIEGEKWRNEREREERWGEGTGVGESNGQVVEVVDCLLLMNKEEKKRI